LRQNKDATSRNPVCTALGPRSKKRRRIFHRPIGA
jgi:hypothetical protein